jgi:chondroitin 4-sulfotransferase 11
MISEQYRCIFVEVPKTGSTSIREILGYSPKPHLNIWQLRELVDPSRFASYFKFAFVRNPWDRLVSLYERKEGMQLRDAMSFEEFVDWAKLSSSTCVHPVPHRFQLDWLIDPHGNVLVDFIGRFERLEEDWAKISEKLGIKQVLPHAKQNPRAKHYTEYYTPRTREIVAKRFHVDLEYFGYSFGG